MRCVFMFLRSRDENLCFCCVRTWPRDRETEREVESRGGSEWEEAVGRGAGESDGGGVSKP